MQLTSSVTCQECGNISETIVMENIVELPFAASLLGAISSFQKSEVINAYECARCAHKTKANK